MRIRGSVTPIVAIVMESGNEKTLQAGALTVNVDDQLAQRGSGEVLQEAKDSGRGP